ncbi:FUSC family protein [Virgibacillus sp. NKC19-3]|uniref:aromatic acid exporter family protein n=1 Tax=Virgibacillus saliphilus TaxID=2831674 RepID=UPI001C9A72A3|nr:aromatic acid exporter family protein [Virgibacillus sp. NKC19-3]MBY7144028.1 FUSC family protein [Virgibacillus sp. NKC19-3]
MRRFHFVGSRVAKTGVSIFLTAWICELLGWPPVFAVITAIVTIEPTVSDSIKKGIVRLPASAIGSAYAVLFIALFGNSPLTYTLAAVFTITTCFRLKLHAGLLVATLTAVAMVEVIHSNYFISFVIRLGTTTVGILVSTVVNMFVFPPDYTEDIMKNIRAMGKRTGKITGLVFRGILEDKQNVAEKDMVDQLEKKMMQTETLIRFQKEEAKYHPLVGSEKLQFDHAQNQMVQLRLIHYHIDNLINTPLTTNNWSKEEKSIILHAVTKLSKALEDESYYNPVKHQQELRQITEIFWEDNEEITRSSKQYPTNFPPELIILYELLSIYNLVTKFYRK